MRRVESEIVFVGLSPAAFFKLDIGMSNRIATPITLPISNANPIPVLGSIFAILRGEYQN